MPSPVTLKIKFKAANLLQFIERYAVDVSKGGIFIRTPKPLAVGTALKFEFQLQDGGPLLSGNGTVVWIREPDPSKGGGAPGMGVRFDQLPPDSQQILDDVLSRKERAAQAAFHDQPTRVADLPMADLGVPVTAATQQPAYEPRQPERSTGPHQTARRVSGTDGQRVESVPERPVPAMSPEPVSGETGFGAQAEEHEPVERSPIIPSPTGPEFMPPPEEEGGADEAERKDRLEKILFSSEGRELGAARAPEPAMPAERGEPEDYEEPMPGRPESRSSPMIWVIVLLLIGAGGYLAYRYLSKKSDTPPDEKAAVTPDSAPKPKGVALKLESDPVGAKIFVDGKDTGKVTPAEVADLDPTKEVEIRLDRPGSKLFTTKVKPPGEAPIKPTLEEAERRVQFQSEPTGANVMLDGKRIGKTPVEYKKPIDFTKPHKLVFSLAGHTDVTRELKDEGWTRDGENEVLTVSVTLEKKGAKKEGKVEGGGEPGAEPKKAEPKKAEPKPKIKRPRPKPEPKPKTDEEPKTEPEPKPAPESAKPKKEEDKSAVKKPTWSE